MPEDSWGTGRPDYSQTVSGDHIYQESGARVIADVDVEISSGLHVLVSGQHVYVESGVFVIADVEAEVSSGLHVVISGQHVYVESGVHVIVESGIHVIADIAESGIGVQIQSGAGVLISGQHVYVESGTILGAGSKIMLVNQSGDIVQVDTDHRALIVEDTKTWECHGGNMFRMDCCYSGIADDHYLGMLITPASGKTIHTTFSVEAGGDAAAKLYENVLIDPAASGCTSGHCPGGLCICHDMNRETSGQPDTTFCCVTSGVVASGQISHAGAANLLTCIKVPGGKFAGGSVNEEVEWILNGKVIVSGMPQQYLIHVLNKGGAAKDLSINVEFSEEE